MGHFDFRRSGKLFVYGTLLDTDVVRAVVPREAWSWTWTPAALPDFERVCVSGFTFPALRRRKGSVVDGSLISGITPKQADALSVYEGSEYVPTECVIATEKEQVRAFVYLPTSRIRLSPKPWSLATWQRLHKSQYLKNV